MALSPSLKLAPKYSRRENDIAYDQCYQTAFDNGKSEWFNQLSCDGKEVLKQIKPWRFYECYCCHSPCRVFNIIGKDKEIPKVEIARLNMKTGRLEIPIIKTFDEVGEFICNTAQYDAQQLDLIERFGHIGAVFETPWNWENLNPHIKGTITFKDIMQQLRDNRVKALSSNMQNPVVSSIAASICILTGRTSNLTIFDQNIVNDVATKIRELETIYGGDQ